METFVGEFQAATDVEVKAGHKLSGWVVLADGKPCAKTSPGCACCWSPGRSRRAPLQGVPEEKQRR